MKILKDLRNLLENIRHLKKSMLLWEKRSIKVGDEVVDPQTLDVLVVKEVDGNSVTLETTMDYMSFLRRTWYKTEE